MATQNTACPSPGFTAQQRKRTASRFIFSAMCQETVTTGVDKEYTVLGYGQFIIMSVNC